MSGKGSRIPTEEFLISKNLLLLGLSVDSPRSLRGAICKKRKMEKVILKDIQRQAREQAESFQLYHNYLELGYQRNKRRINNAPPKEIKIPSEWMIDKKI